MKTVEDLADIAIKGSEADFISTLYDLVKSGDVSKETFIHITASAFSENVIANAYKKIEKKPITL